MSEKRCYSVNRYRIDKHYTLMKKKTIKSFVLRVDSDTMDAIEQWAEDEFRSINGQLQYIISEALRKNGRLIKRSVEQNNNQDEKDSE